MVFIAAAGLSADFIRTLMVRGEDPVTVPGLLMGRGKRPRGYKTASLGSPPPGKAIFAMEDPRRSLGDIPPISRKGLAEDGAGKQEPSAGNSVFEKLPANPALNRRSGRGPTVPFDAGRGVGLLKYKTEYGFISRRIRVRLNWRGLACDVFDDHIASGKQIWVFIPRDEDVRVFVYEDGLLVDTRNFNNR